MIRDLKKDSAAVSIAIRLELLRTELHERRVTGMEGATPPRRRRGHDAYPEHNRWEREEQYTANLDGLAPKGPVARFAVIGALALLLVTACASAFSMLIWEPAADPPAITAPLVSSQPGREANATRPGVLDIRGRTFHRAGRNLSSRSVLRSCTSHAAFHGVRTRLREGSAGQNCPRVLSVLA